MFRTDLKEKEPLSSSILKELIDVTAEERVLVEEEVLREYSFDQSFTPPCSPLVVVFPITREEIQKVVAIANHYHVPITPYSSGKDFMGAAVPAFAGILLSLEKMKRILRVNTQEWNAILEAGVTYQELHQELEKVGFRIATPLLVSPAASVVSTIIQRNHPTTATDFNYGNELIFGYELVLPDGSYFNVGKQAVGGPGRYVGQPTGPGLNFWRLFQGACGTLGIVTSMAVKIMKIPKIRKVHFFPCKDIKEAIEVISKTQRKELGLECFALNKFNLSVYLISETKKDEERLNLGTYVGRNGAQPWNSEQKKEFDEIRKLAPPWTVVIISAGFERRAEEKIAYEEEDIRECGFPPHDTIPGLSRLDEIILKDTLKPRQMQKRFGFKGTIQPLSFYSPITRVSEFEKIIKKEAESHQYPVDEIGGYLLPLERGRAIFCQFDIHSPAEDQKYRDKVKVFYQKVSEILVEEGAFFDPPYGIWAEMIYRKTGTYTEYLKRLKKELDPNNIMNPGKLCFK